MELKEDYFKGLYQCEGIFVSYTFNQILIKKDILEDLVFFSVRIWILFLPSTMKLCFLI